MNVFSSLRVYPEGWSVKSSRAFSAEEIAAVKEAFIVPSEYGNSCCFMMASGGKAYIPMSTMSKGTVGDAVDLNSAKLLTLEREGDKDILRVEI